MYIYLGWLLRPRKKRRILRNALICAICHYYAYSFTGRGAQEAYFQGKLYGEAGHYYHRYPATVFFHISPTEEEEEEDALVLLIEIIMRPVGEFMGHPVIIRSLKPTNNLLSPRSWRWWGWGWRWWGWGWYWQCWWLRRRMCASDGWPIIRSLSRAKTFSPVSIPPSFTNTIIMKIWWLGDKIVSLSLGFRKATRETFCFLPIPSLPLSVSLLGENERIYVARKGSEIH